MRHQLERNFAHEQRRKHPDDERPGERHAAVSHDVEHLIAADRPARAGSEPRIDAAKEKRLMMPAGVPIRRALKNISATLLVAPAFCAQLSAIEPAMPCAAPSR